MSDNVQKIKEEIERRMNNLWYLIPEGEKVLKDDFTKDDANNLGKYTALENLLHFIDSLPEEPASEDLEEEILVAYGRGYKTAYIECYEQAMKEFLEKACEWLEDNFSISEGMSGYQVSNDFKKYMQYE